MNHMDIFNSLIISNQDEVLRLREESDDDYIEYKLRLDSKTKFGIDRLISQMNYRLDIGKSTLKRKEAHYVLGICDNGTLGGLTEQDIDKTFGIFSKIVNDCGATIVHIKKQEYNGSYLIYAIIQKIESFKIKELNVVFVGPTQHGKTTSISHLVYGQKDDGTGYSRKLIFKHEHEKISGITSSIKKEIIGICKGMLVNYNVGIGNGWEDIVEMSNKIINLIDLPGNLKYFKSTFFGLSTYDIDGIVIVVDKSKLNNYSSNNSSNNLSNNSSNEIIFYELFAKTFNIPYVILNINDTICNSRIDSGIDSRIDNTINFSNVTGKGLSELINFLNTIEKKVPATNITDATKTTAVTNSLFCVSETYCVPDVGTIFSGTMKQGILSIGTMVYLTDGNTYIRTQIKSIQRKQIDSKTLYTGENGAIQLNFDDHTIPEVSKHMIITTTQYPTFNNFIFKNLSQNIEFTNGQQCMMFVDNIISNVTILNSMNINDNNCIILKSTNNIIVPSINTSKCIAFLKHDNGIVFGYLNLV